jgi:hypothetical protein
VPAEGKPARSVAGWYDFSSTSPIFASNFCVVVGQDDRRPLLESLAAETAAACDALAVQDISLAERQVRNLRAIYVPMIVTTVPLQMALYDASKIILADGKISELNDVRPVDTIWFRKSLATDLTNGAAPQDLAEANADMERSVLIVSAPVIEGALKSLRPGDPPWQRRG